MSGEILDMLDAAEKALIEMGRERDEWADAIRSVAPGYIASPAAAKHAIQELRDMQLKATRERDELFARLADLSWEKMSPREQAVWAAAFAILFTWDDDTPKAKDTADEAVLELRKEALK